MRAARPFSRSFGAACLPLAFILSSCDSRPQPPVGKVRELNEIPIPQLRVFLKGYPGEWRPDSDRAQERPEPRAEKEIPKDAKRIALVPATQLRLGNLPVRDAIASGFRPEAGALRPFADHHLHDGIRRAGTSTTSPQDRLCRRTRDCRSHEGAASRLQSAGSGVGC